MKKIYCCTLFDSNYLLYGLALYKSLLKYFPAFHLWILCLDSNCYEKLKELKLSNVSLLTLEDIESKELNQAKANRSWKEFCWTLSSVFTHFVFQRNKKLDHIIYLDADICFFSNPELIFKELGSASIMIIPHRFPERLHFLNKYGVYNVQMLYFCRDEIALNCLEKWRQQCLEWCNDKVENGKMGDQKYLDEWPNEYKNICILKNTAAGVALWNAEQYEICMSDNNNNILIDEKPLIFYHFHSFRYYAKSYYITHFYTYLLDFEKVKIIYLQYVRILEEISKEYAIRVKKISLFQYMINVQGSQSEYLFGLYPWQKYRCFLYKLVCRLLLVLSNNSLYLKNMFKFIKSILNRRAL